VIDPGYEVETIRGLNRSVSQYGRNADGSWGKAIRSMDYAKMPGMGERLVYDSADPAYNKGLAYQSEQAQAIKLQGMKDATDIATAKINAQGYVDSAKIRYGQAGDKTNLMALRAKAATAGDEAMKRAQGVGVTGEALEKTGRLARAKYLFHQLGAVTLPQVDEQTGMIFGQRMDGTIINEFGEDVTAQIEATKKVQQRNMNRVLDSFNEE
jgi:hypothetical protein